MMRHEDLNKKYKNVDFHKANFEKKLNNLFDLGNKTGNFEEFDKYCQFYIKNFGKDSFERFLENNF